MGSTLRTNGSTRSPWRWDGSHWLLGSAGRSSFDGLASQAYGYGANIWHGSTGRLGYDLKDYQASKNWRWRILFAKSKDSHLWLHLDWYEYSSRWLETVASQRIADWFVSSNSGPQSYNEISLAPVARCTGLTSSLIHRPPGLPSSRLRFSEWVESVIKKYFTTEVK